MHPSIIAFFAQFLIMHINPAFFTFFTSITRFALVQFYLQQSFGWKHFMPVLRFTKFYYNCFYWKHGLQ